MRRLAVLIVVALATGSCALRGPARSTDVLGALKEQFNRDRGVPRLVVLVSPT